MDRDLTYGLFGSSFSSALAYCSTVGNWNQNIYNNLSIYYRKCSRSRMTIFFCMEKRKFFFTYIQTICRPFLKTQNFYEIQRFNIFIFIVNLSRNYEQKHTTEFRDFYRDLSSRGKSLKMCLHSHILNGGQVCGWISHWFTELSRDLVEFESMIHKLLCDLMN